MTIRSTLSRTILAAVALALGVVATAPAMAGSRGGHEAKICLKILKPHCIRL